MSDDLNAQKTIILPHGAWNTVLSIIAKSTGFCWEVTNPLIYALQNQLRESPPELDKMSRPRVGEHTDMMNR